MSQYAAVLTFVDYQEPHAEDAQRVIGMTGLCDSKSDAEQRGMDLALEYLKDEYPRDWKMRIESGLYGIHLDVMTPGKCSAHEFLFRKTAQVEQENLVFA